MISIYVIYFKNYFTRIGFVSFFYKNFVIKNILRVRRSEVCERKKLFKARLRLFFLNRLQNHSMAIFRGEEEKNVYCKIFPGSQTSV